MALVVENTGVRVSASKVRVRARSANPPQRSTIISPFTAKAKRAPSSSPAAKAARKASRTGTKRSWQRPWMWGVSDMAHL